jgi:hypothetical protein
MFERHVRQRALGRHALPFRAGCNAGELVAGFLFVGASKNLAQVCKLEMLSHFSCLST